MNMSDENGLPERLARAPNEEELQRALSLEAGEERERLFSCADQVRRRIHGDGILLRGLIEFSSHCRNTCLYCGLQRANRALERYRLSREELLAAVEKVASYGIKTIVLQAGEDYGIEPGWLACMVRDIKTRYDMAITLSAGEWDEAAYRLWREAGADRYLLRIETSDRALYRSLHPGMSFDRRLQCLKILKALGFQVGSGIIVGLPGQDISSIARDILFFRHHDFDMIGIGPLIPHQDTELAGVDPGGVALTLKVIALTRIVAGRAHIPATTALGSLDRDYRGDALRCGANVLMPNFTPPSCRRLYEIYPQRRCVEESGAHCAGCMENLALAAGRCIDYSRGDAVKY